MLDLNERVDLTRATGCYSGKLFRVEDDVKYEMDCQTSITMDEANELRLEIIMDGCQSGETMPLVTDELSEDLFTLRCNESEESLKGEVDLLNKMLSFKVESPRSGETEFVGCL
ncbi:hypothetical protein [Flammeovirga kamogawensis]|uniref:Uncharacterized protein n=1 Tax=Flammeovirga kamogawensis TaxID=373891 RepID=A0ABX8GVW2_9BACT|nr:hypothetical protein [Flammeovirga kamogawensis]MBB6459589.1 hypothetical protein [Flammeovirga kamogawensis]QWG07347.1 hypothetical protein KM029_18890 [Flammeovirga kamogawensis]TRX69164.1 hypothetical protein EO216_13890 [Flammeovirga kamogawensis]